MRIVQNVECYEKGQQCFHRRSSFSVTAVFQGTGNSLGLHEQILQAHSVRSTLRQEAMESLRRVRAVPRWVRVVQSIYHDYGLKHICLILLLVAYQFLGAGIFYYCEVSNDETKEIVWNENIRLNRTKFIQQIIPTMFNNTEYLFFLTAEQTRQVRYGILHLLTKKIFFENF